jgi:hypothetical protein
MVPGVSEVAPTNPSSPGTNCDRAIDASPESDLLKLAEIPLSTSDVVEPTLIEPDISVSATIASAALCSSHLSPSVDTSHYSGAEPFLALSTVNPTLGPFDWLMNEMAWTLPPGSPTGQNLKASFAPVGTSVEIGPQIHINQSGISLPLVSLTLQAAALSVQLVSNGAARLEVTLGPAIDISAEVKPGNILKQAETEEAAGESPPTAEADAASQVADDAGTGIYEAAQEYGVTMNELDHTAVTGDLQAVESELVSALEEVPALAGEASPNFGDPVDAAPVDTADAETIDALAGGEATDIGFDFIFIIFL